MGIQGPAYNLISSFLTTRSQCVEVNGVISETRKKSLQKVHLNARYLMFADDTVFIYSEKDQETLQSKINNDLETFSSWLCANKLLLNEEKTVYIQFNYKRRNHAQLQIVINNQEIKKVRQHKYLGLVVDEKLSWNEHIDNIFKKLGSLVAAVKLTEFLGDIALYEEQTIHTSMLYVSTIYRFWEYDIDAIIATYLNRLTARGALKNNVDFASPTGKAGERPAENRGSNRISCLSDGRISEDKRLGSEIEVFADIRRYHAYTTLNAKNQFRAPTEWGIVLRPTTVTSTGKTADNSDDDPSPSSSYTSSDQLRCLACDSERVRSCWVLAMRLAKYGKQLRENYRAFRNKQGDSVNSKDYNSYSVPNESVRSRVAMDFAGGVGRIVEDPQEATAIAVAEGYSWKRRWRGYTRGSSGLNQSQTAYVQSIDAGIHMTQPWFHSGLTRDKAAELVSKHGTVDGVFLVRDSRSNPGSYVITYKCGGKVIHAQVNPILDPLRDRPVFSIDNGVTKFYDLLQLVEFYQLNAGCLPTRLTHYVTFLLTEESSSEKSDSPNTSKKPASISSGSSN
ncbi:unnamed protein product [Phyllotreta striolata]|uniref:SH2 domain-containing protein n=1 Tax=Phyllotreta striolata TaxID=444603 RepID=A0A9N9XJE8_PHYSR|nr:unnamed protein product [Phyllotreta striolata]